MSTENDGSVIKSALDVLELVGLLADNFEPRSLENITAQCQGRGWSRSKIFGMLATLDAAGWVTKRDGLYSLSPHLAKIAIAWTQRITARAQALLAEVAAVQGTQPPTFFGMPSMPPSDPSAKSDQSSQTNPSKEQQ